MTKRKIIAGILLIVITAIISCKTKRQNPYENTFHMQPGFLASIDTANYTTIEWLDTTVNFGTLKEGDSIRMTYRFKNTGSKPLLISQVRPACGCTIVNYSEEPVLSGEESEIVANFNSEGHPGFTNKTIQVVSNAKNKIKQNLLFTGMVEGHKK